MTINGIYSPVTFGPVFNHDVLMEVYHLQNALTNIVVKRSDGFPIHLSDICFKPLYLNNSNCMIESVINYFQNNLTRLNYSETDDFGVKKVNALSHAHPFLYQVVNYLNHQFLNQHNIIDYYIKESHGN